MKPNESTNWSNRKSIRVGQPKIIIYKMKNLFVISIATLAIGASLQTSAQTEEGNILVAGKSNFQALSSSNSWKSDVDKGVDTKIIQLNFTPTVGYFVIDNLAIGVMFSMYYSSENEDDGSEKTNTLTVLMPFARYYFGAEVIRPFVELAAGLGNQKTYYNSVNESFDFDSYASVKTGQMSGGIDFFLNDNVALELGLGYAYSSYKPKDDNDNNYRSITKGLGLKAGIVVVF